GILLLQDGKRRDCDTGFENEVSRREKSALVSLNDAFLIAIAASHEDQGHGHSQALASACILP
ncbi:hypothetical protein AX14_008136, partial [Amanita brunnescens Koide BX004]